jgi:hypothetical protein
MRKGAGAAEERLLITHLCLVPKLRMRGAMPPRPQCVSIAWYLVKQRGGIALHTYLCTNWYATFSLCQCMKFETISRLDMKKNLIFFFTVKITDYFLICPFVSLWFSWNTLPLFHITRLPQILFSSSTIHQKLRPGNAQEMRSSMTCVHVTLNMHLVVLLYSVNMKTLNCDTALLTSDVSAF